jgi:hypothetical protein
VLTSSLAAALSNAIENNSTETEAYDIGVDDLADMDFMDPEVSIFEMRKRVAKGMPIPEQVMNDIVRSYQPEEKDFYHTLADGRYENKMLGGVELRELPARKLREFHEWLSENEIKIPKGFSDYPEDIRVLQCRDFDH